METTNFTAGETKNAERPTILDIQTRYHETVKGQKFSCPKEKNKGKAGLFLEEKLGIPTSSECLDCKDGELKAFPQVKVSRRSRLAKQCGLCVGDYIASETVAITMVKPNELVDTPFEQSRLFKKISKVLFIPYVRDGDYIEFRNDVVFDVNHPLFAQIREDYETIQTFYKSNGFTKSEVGNMIQIRTKGQGGNSPKTYAFYFRRQFLISIFQ